jgi:peptidoglycan L-alanyl-D-glutamate endopeptidase CwlK
MDGRFLSASLRLEWGRPLTYNQQSRPFVSSRIDNLLPDVAWRANAFRVQMARIGLPVRITQTVRPEFIQRQLFAMGRTKSGPIVTYARPSTSLHEYGRAFDFTFQTGGFSVPDHWWGIAGQVGESLGLRWGGRFAHFSDRPHFEL